MVGEICKKREMQVREDAQEKASKRSIRQIETKETIRVDLEKLDHLINLVGELVIAESMVTHNPDLADLELDNFDKASSHLNKIVRELQDVAMNIRMVPVSGLFKRMIRLVHDLARSADKQARIELIGEETEIDKTVIEMVSDPLVHIIRNAVDHGLESPEERQEKGKDAKGQIRLEARHEGGEVWILVSDDGRGLNRERILQRSLERELITDGAVETMTDDQIYSLIFAPGFSTAEKITDVSGRGVGMDVVKQNIEKLNGRVSIRSFDGKGSTFVLRIPLTLAIIEGMIVRVGSSIYTIPILSIRESVRLQEGLITKTMNGEEVARIREELIPVMRLYELHGLEPDNRDLTEGILIIVEDGGHNLGLFVDEIVEQHQAVVKGLSSYIGNVRGIMGCTILGDGRISLILDIGRIVGKALHNETA
jgi:two-component system chemotaxis sensor kinase CheA